MDYGILSIIPPVLIIAMAFITKQVMLSLITGIIASGLVIYGGNVLSAVTLSFSDYVVGALMDYSHAANVVFLLTMGGMIEIVSRTGGLQALTNVLKKYIKSTKSAQVTTCLLGILIFFDDYANLLVVGPAANLICDNHRISREKQNFIVHNTAGLVAGIAVLTTWVGFEIGCITDVFADMGYEVNGLTMIIKNVPYMIYNIMAVVLMLSVAFMLRDFGPMYKAEMRARTTGKVIADDANIATAEYDEIDLDKQGKVWYAVVPIVAMVITLFIGLWINGYQYHTEEAAFFSFQGFRLSLADADPLLVMVWSSTISTLFAALIAKFCAKMSIGDIINHFLKGAHGLLDIVIVLVLAWSIGSIMGDVGTANYIVGLIGDSIPGGMLPAIIFVISCLISYATGTSWGTMPLMFPLALPLVATFVEDPTESPLIIATIAAVLSGAIFGDQTSPISDSSIISSATVKCDLLHHIKTQTPYELLPAAFAVVGLLITGISGIPIWVILIAETIVTILFVRFIGKTTDPKYIQI